MASLIKPLIEPSSFVGLDEVTHLCTGGEAPWLKAFEEVHADFARLKSRGWRGVKRYTVGVRDAAPWWGDYGRCLRIGSASCLAQRKV
jgi:hypothetical protein